jgi:hypothetical protein
MESMYREMGMDLHKFLDGLQFPIVLVDDQGVVRTGNDPACQLLHKGLHEVEGFRGGEVFRCSNAILPGGCGNTVHCSGCVIRRTVMETHATGKSCLKVPALLKQQSSTDPQEVRFLISTEKVGDYVWLRVDEVGSAG